MPRRPTVSTLSSFSTLPSITSINNVAHPYDPTDEDSTESAYSGSASSGSVQATIRRSSTFDQPERLAKALAGLGASVSDDHLPMVQQVVETYAQERKMGVKKKKSLAHSVKKAGILAVRKMGVPKTWTQRHSKLQVASRSQEALDLSPQGHVVVQNPAAAESTSSLTVECGSPGYLGTLPKSPPLPTRDSIQVTRLHQALALDAHGPPHRDYLSTLRLKLFRFSAKVLLFIPYTILVGFIPFLWPDCLSRVVFAPIINVTRSPLAPMDKFAYHARFLPYHVGVSLGLLFVVLWSLGKSYPGLAVSLLATFVGRTMWAWGDHEFEPDVNQANLGVDDRSTIVWLLRGYILGDLIHSWKDFSKLYRERDVVEDGEEDIEMETLERLGSQGVDFVIRLKDRPHECLRIVVDSAESSD